MIDWRLSCIITLERQEGLGEGSSSGLHTALVRRIDLEVVPVRVVQPQEAVGVARKQFVPEAHPQRPSLYTYQYTYIRTTGNSSSRKHTPSALVSMLAGVVYLMCAKV